jgi:hypothetical protein
MAITLRRRSPSRPDLGQPRDDVVAAERTALTALAETLRELAAGLPAESRLAVELGAVARSIDVAGVLGTWRLQAAADALAAGTG